MTDLIVFLDGAEAGKGVSQFLMGDSRIYQAVQIQYQASGTNIRNSTVYCIASNGMPISINAAIQDGQSSQKYETTFDPYSASMFDTSDLRKTPRREAIPEGYDTARKDMLWFLTHYPKLDETYAGLIFNFEEEQWEMAVTKAENLDLLASKSSGSAGARSKPLAHISTTVSTRRTDYVIDGSKKIYWVKHTRHGLLEVIDKKATSLLPQIREALGIRISPLGVPEYILSDPDSGTQPVK